MRWEAEIEYMGCEVGERAAWLMVLEFVAWGNDERVALYLGSYASMLTLASKTSRMVRPMEAVR